MGMHVRKGDLVYIRTGDDKGRTGKVLRVIPKDDKVLVEGVNIRKRHMRPTEAQRQGSIVEKEMPIHISNVSPVSDGKPTRVRFEVAADGSKRRIAVKTGQQLGQELKKARS